jgi:hypothetical protein
MDKYIQIVMKSDNAVSHSERKSFLKSFYGSTSTRKKGSIQKFCNAIGFKPVIDDYMTDYPVIHSAVVKSPDTYTTPDMLFYKAMWVDLSKNGIVKFVVPMGKEEHPDSQYSYNHEDICKQFVKYLKKVYPNVQIEVSYLKSFRYTVKTFVLNYFYQSMNFEDDIYTVECSGHRMLTDKEIEQIYKDMDGATNYKWHIDQYFCETCKHWHADAPYHIEVVYDR